MRGVGTQWDSGATWIRAEVEIIYAGIEGIRSSIYIYIYIWMDGYDGGPYKSTLALSVLTVILAENADHKKVERDENANHKGHRLRRYASGNMLQ